MGRGNGGWDPSGTSATGRPTKRRTRREHYTEKRDRMKKGKMLEESEGTNHSRVGDFHFRTHGGGKKGQGKEKRKKRCLKRGKVKKGGTRELRQPPGRLEPGSCRG